MDLSKETIQTTSNTQIQILLHNHRYMEETLHKMESVRSTATLIMESILIKKELLINKQITNHLWCKFKNKKIIHKFCNQKETVEFINIRKLPVIQLKDFSSNSYSFVLNPKTTEFWTWVNLKSLTKKILQIYWPKLW